MTHRRLILLVFFGVIAISEWYAYQAVKSLTQNRKILWGYLAVNILVYLVIAGFMITFNSKALYPKNLLWISSLLLIFCLPKLIIALFLLVGDLFRGVEFLTERLRSPAAEMPSRRKFISWLGLGFAGLLSYSFLDGIVWGKYRHFVRQIKLKIPNLPESFKGYKVVQISDVHSGSFAHLSKLQHAIDLINAQNADLVLFTGDMVNSYAEEFKPFIPLFSTIQAKDGKFSVLGNHDYGFYGKFDSEAEQNQNVPKLVDYEKQAGFEMLRNEFRAIERNGEKLYIIGVENWGLPPFPQFGDLDKATQGIPKVAAKILMSHDPTHFDEKVKMHPSDIALTLSGHTHGMQFGLDLKNVKWSPIKYKYPKWIDLYESMGKHLYVNRGFGVLVYPGRVGVNPEITVFELS